MSLSLFFRTRRLLIGALATASLAFLPPAFAHESSSRTLDTAKGPLTLTGTPQRVVTLDESALDTALALGIQPVGAVSTRASNSVSDYLKDKAGEMAIVGATREINLEAVLATRPDLILASENISEQSYALLSRLAPTLIPRAGSQDDWRARVREYAAALDRSEQAELALESVDQRMTALTQRIPTGKKVAVLRWNPQGPILMSKQIFTGQILSELGLDMPPLAGQLGNKPHSDTLSLENLGQADADWLFVATLNPQGQETLDQASKQPAFTRLQAVRNNQVISVDGQLWSSASGLLAAQRLLDDVEQALLP